MSVPFLVRHFLLGYTNRAVGVHQQSYWATSNRESYWPFLRGPNPNWQQKFLSVGMSEELKNCNPMDTHPNVKDRCTALKNPDALSDEVTKSQPYHYKHDRLLLFVM